MLLGASGNQDLTVHRTSNYIKVAHSFCEWRGLIMMTPAECEEFIDLLENALDQNKEKEETE
jgi:hypothetical protein